MSDDMNRRKFLGLAPAFPAAAVTAKLTLTDDKGVATDLDVSVLRLQPGDVIVFRTPHTISSETGARIKAFAEHGLELERRGIKAIVLSDGVEVAGVLR